MLYEISSKHGRFGVHECAPGQIESYLTSLPIQSAPYRMKPVEQETFTLKKRIVSLCYHPPTYFGFIYGVLVASLVWIVVLVLL